MKRIGGDGLDAGHRRLLGENRPGVARPGRARSLALSAPPSLASAHAAGFRGSRARDFEDFVAGDAGWTTLRRTLPDPGFREGLRRRLWRIHLMKRALLGLDRN